MLLNVSTVCFNKKNETAEDISKAAITKYTAHVTQTENDIIKILTLHTTSDQSSRRKLPSLLGKINNDTEGEKPIFLKSCLRKRFYKLKLNDSINHLALNTFEN